jgi:hypothetical protein
MHINDSGSVGIGTSSPTSGLHVSSTVLATGDTHYGVFRALSDNSYAAGVGAVLQLG